MATEQLEAQKAKPTGSGLPEMPSEVYLAEKKPKRPIDWRRLSFMMLGIGLFVLVYLSPTFPAAVDTQGKVFHLSPQGQAAIGLFLLPLWGVRGNIRDRKAERVAALQAKLEAADHDDVAALEAVTAHIDRLRGLSNWPVDLRLATRIFAYVIIPPLAWVGAALVENLVDRF